MNAPAMAPPALARPAQTPGVVFPLAMLAAYWGVTGFVWGIEIPFFFRFLYSMAGPALFFIAFSIWWWRRSDIPRADRVIGYLLVVGGALFIGPLAHPSMGFPQPLMAGLPIVMSLWIVWTLLVAGRPDASPGAGADAPAAGFPRFASMALGVAAWAAYTLVRMEGLDGDLRADFHWRWTPTAEERFLAQRSGEAAAPQKESSSETPAKGGRRAAPELETEPVAATRLTLAPGDWPEFRGQGRTGSIPGVRIDADWQASPPTLVWKQLVGPAWSSVIVVGDRLFTQEQRGEQEAVVCYDAATGKQLWIHEDADRFYEAVSGPGPRATPTFAQGRIVTLGARGILNVLDAVDGKLQWTRNLREQDHAEIPMWGVSSSPLAVDGRVIAYGGGAKQHNLLAFDLESGKPAWTAEAGDASYASPQLAVVDGVRQVLMFHDLGATSVDPATGEVLWRGGAPMPGAPRNLQLHQLDGLRFVAGTLAGIGIGAIQLAHSSTGWTSDKAWESSDMKPEFSELVVHEGFAYGFDGAIFCCVDLETGKRRWKAGRYGRGQAILLPDCGRIVVLGEAGQCVLLAANPERHQELGKFQALEGKNWNHPVIVRGKLYVRNAQEMACFELSKELAQ